MILPALYEEAIFSWQVKNSQLRNATVRQLFALCGCSQLCSDKFPELSRSNQVSPGEAIAQGGDIPWDLGFFPLANISAGAQSSRTRGGLFKNEN